MVPSQLGWFAAQRPNSARTREALLVLLLDLKGHSRQAALETSSLLGVEDTEQSVAD